MIKVLSWASYSQDAGYMFPAHPFVESSKEFMSKEEALLYIKEEEKLFGSLGYTQEAKNGRKIFRNNTQEPREKWLSIKETP